MRGVGGSDVLDLRELGDYRLQAHTVSATPRCVVLLRCGVAHVCKLAYISAGGERRPRIGA
jgi:hypothetical protein